MKLTVLISCMYQKDTSIIKRSNVQTDVVVVNQCDEDKIQEFDFVNRKGNSCRVKFICTTERGLSRSRNMAIKYANTDICLICDDDEELVDNYEDIVIEGHKKHIQAIVVIFALNRKGKIYSKMPYKINFFKAFGISSHQITFKRLLVVDQNIKFDILMGSGTGNGAGEENKFIHDCRRTGYKLFYEPEIIATLKEQSDSQWFNGYNTKYFENHGWSCCRIHGPLISAIYILYFVCSHYTLYKSTLSWGNALYHEYKGWLKSIRKN